MIETDTICALATPTGGAIAIIRTSGNESRAIVARLFDKPIDKPRQATVGHIVSTKGDVIDEAVVTYYQSPHSYTGEDCVEISIHGSRYIADATVQLLIEGGCRQARPGEFTKRAFLNGKMDLTQAEAVADLISATNRASHDMAISQLRGGVSTQLAQMRDQLQHLTSLLELELDFSDHEDLEFADRTELLRLSETIRGAVRRLADSFKTGRAIKQGIGVAIVGKTNVGKSTLLNRLLGEERAIVSDTHGTTRDTIEETITIHGLTFRFIDTAGLRQTDDTIEQIGIARTYQKLDEAQIVVWLIDEPPTQTELQQMRSRCNGKRLLIVQNKLDLASSSSSARIPIAELAISAKQGTGIAALEEAIYAASDIPEIGSNDVIITSARHYEILLRADASLTRVITSLRQGITPDLIAEDLRQCILTLNEITGQAITSDTTLQTIFSEFCVGK